MKKMLGACGLLFMLATATVAFARDSGPGNPGGGNFDCARCMGQGGLGIPAHYICQQTEYGTGSGCQAGTQGCTYSGGCVSLPDDLGGGFHP